MEDHKHIHVSILLENLLEYSQYALNIELQIQAEVRGARDVALLFR